MKINDLIDNEMKHFILPIINSVLIFMLGVYLLVTKDINTQALDKVNKLELQVENQKEMINFLTNVNRNTEKSDTIVVNVNEKFNVRVKLEQ